MRIDSERPRDGDALRLAARQLARQRAGAMVDAECGQQLAAAADRVVLPHAVRVDRRQADVLDRRQVLEEAMKLKDHAGASAVDRDVTRVVSIETGNRAENRRLARARRSHDAHDFPARGGEGHAA